MDRSPADSPRSDATATPGALPSPVRYLRVSVTDRCNLRCAYCAPWRDASRAVRDDLLTLEQVAVVVRAAAAAGVGKVRVTGGEPLARSGIATLLSDISAIEGLQDLALTTNGTLLRARMPDLLASRFRRVNVHLDTLDPARYRQVCGADMLPEVRAGIEAASAAGLRLKINAVCEAGMEVDDALALARFGIERGIDVRFIEAMPVAGAGDGDRIAAGRVESHLADALGLVPEGRDGVSRMFRAPGSAGRVGFITPSHARFCSGCDKLRLSSRGLLRTCLYAKGGTDLRPMLREGDEAGVRRAVAAAMARKSASAGREGCEVATMIGIGG